VGYQNGDLRKEQAGEDQKVLGLEGMKLVVCGVAWRRPTVGAKPTDDIPSGLKAVAWVARLMGGIRGIGLVRHERLQVRVGRPDKCWSTQRDLEHLAHQ